MSKTPGQSVSVDTVLKTSRCVLRYPLREHAGRMLTALRSPSFPEYVPLGQIGSVEEVHSWIDRIHSCWAGGAAFSWSVEQQMGQVLLGQVTISIKTEPNTWALAFWISPKYWGPGYATEAAGKLIKFGFRNLGASVIWASAAQRNYGSLRVLEKLGMVHVADNPEGYMIKGEAIPTREFDLRLTSRREETGIAF